MRKLAHEEVSVASDTVTEERILDAGTQLDHALVSDRNARRERHDAYRALHKQTRQKVALCFWLPLWVWDGFVVAFTLMEAVRGNSEYMLPFFLPAVALCQMAFERVILRGIAAVWPGVKEIPDAVVTRLLADYRQQHAISLNQIEVDKRTRG